ncbi:Hsp20/alpha crystallin family protein [Alistipes putredinis]|uniref:Hsp20/alpha crystallin family protein n=2 Tax=Alistipes TaxID=239759 RepID=UPI003AF1BB11
MLPARKNQDWLPSIFNDFFGNEWLVKPNFSTPAINVVETEKEYRVEVAAPGMTKDDFKINLDDENNLTINVEKKEKHFLRREFSYTKFQQSIALPDNTEKEKISAKVEHGVLTIEIPKKQGSEKKVSRTIDVK